MGSARRGRGECSLCRRKDGRWVGQYNLPADLGTKAKYIYGKTRNEVAAKLTKAILGEYEARQGKCPSSPLDSDLSPRTVQIIHATLYKAIRQAVGWLLVPRNVADSVDPPKAPKRAIKPLDEGQVKSLLEAVEGDKVEALYVLAITTGMRSGEPLGLRWEDLDLRARTLQVKWTVFNGRVEAPKTVKGRRSIKLTQTSIGALQKH